MTPRILLILCIVCTLATGLLAAESDQENDPIPTQSPSPNNVGNDQPVANPPGDLPSTVTKSDAEPTSWERGIHHPLHGNVISPVLAGNQRFVVEADELNVARGKAAIKTSGSQNVLDANQSLVLTAPTHIDLNPTGAGVEAEIQSDLFVEYDQVDNVNVVRSNLPSNDLPVTGVGSGVDFIIDRDGTGADSFDYLVDGANELTLRDDGYLRFDTGTDIQRYTTSIVDNNITVPVGAAYYDYVPDEIQAHYQNLSYSNDNDPATTYPSAGYGTHTVTLTNGTNAQIRDYYIPDDQTLNASSTTSPAASYTTHTIDISNGSPVTIRDYFENDTTIPDDQGLSTTRNGENVTVEIDNGSNTQFTDNYEADDQTLTVSSATAPTDSVTTHTLDLVNDSSSHTVQDYYEVDTTIPDDQDLYSSRTGDIVTVGITNGTDGSFEDQHTTYTAGEGLSLSSQTFSVNAPGCSSSQALAWDGSGFTCVSKPAGYGTGDGIGLDTAPTPSEFFSSAGSGITPDPDGHSFSLAGETCPSGEFMQGISSDGTSLQCANSCGDSCAADETCISGSCEQQETWCLDSDGDQYGTSSQQSATDPGSNWYLNSSADITQCTTDCYDSNSDVYPGQTAYFNTSYGPSDSFDYDCDTTAELQDNTVYVGCTGSVNGSCGSASGGWMGGPPACGGTKEYSLGGSCRCMCEGGPHDESFCTIGCDSGNEVCVSQASTYNRTASCK